MNVAEWLQIASTRIASAGYDSARLEARILLELATGHDRQSLISVGALSELSQDDVERADRILFRRLQGEPIAYLRGTQEFFGRDFIVNLSVLIPRPETELLAEAALAFAFPGSICVDVGTGCGCLAVTLSVESPHSTWTASDISTEALIVAQENATRLSADISFINGDLLNWLRPNSVHLIVSNPPYVAPDDPHLETSVRDWEPAKALYSPGGITAIRSLISQGKRALTEGGVLAFEFGLGQSDEVKGLLENWTYEIRTDLQGTDRFILARK